MKPPLRPVAPSPVPVADVTTALASVFAALAVALVAAYLALPAARDWLTAEPGLVSWFTTAGHGAALVIGLWAARRWTRRSRARWLIPALAIWGLCDTAGYGMTQLGIEPITLGGVPLTSATALAAGGGNWASGVGLTPAIGVAAMAAVALGAYATWHRFRMWASLRVLDMQTRVVDFVVLSVGLFVLTPAIGLLGSSRGIQFAAQVTAMTAATVLVAAALAAGDHRRTVAGWRSRIRPWLDHDSVAAEDSAVLHPGVLHPGDGELRPARSEPTIDDFADEEAV